MASTSRMIGFGMALAATPAAAETGKYGKYETPRYVVEQKIGDAELRNYDSHVLARVTVGGSQRGALTEGFRVLAGYIFGGNEGAQSVAMTSPVTQSVTIDMTAPVSQSSEGGSWTVTFMMPSEYTLNDLPKPKSGRVAFEQVPARKMLVLEFSGLAPDARLRRKSGELKQMAQTHAINITGSPVYMFYDDPMTLPWNRRNEVGFIVE